MTAYLQKPLRKNGEARKRPGIFKRILKFTFPWKGDDAGTIVRKLIFIVALVCFIVTAVPLLTDVYSMVKDEVITKIQMNQLYIPTGRDPNVIIVPNEQGVLPSFEKLLDINPDTVGYIKINGTKIDYPVVKGTDNDYYLTHDFWGNINKSGCIMMDHNNVVTEEKTSDNLVLYGHHMAIGTFFAALNEYWRTCYDSYSEPSLQMYKDHPTITFNTLYEESEWKIFAVCLFNAESQYGEAYNYNNKHTFTSREDFNQYIIDIMDRSDLLTDVDVQYGDDILTLSTCSWAFSADMNNVRLGIFARKIRPGESEYVDVSKAKVNPYVKRWKWVYDNVGGGYDWSRSVWDRRKLLSYTAEDAARDGYTFPTD